MALLGRMTGGIRRIIREEHLRTWDRNGGPGALLRAAMRRPLITAIVVAVVLGGILVATFGVPPFSPLALILVVVAPIVPWLRAERAVHDEWLRRSPGTEPDEPAETSGPPDPGAPSTSTDADA